MKQLYSASLTSSGDLDINTPGRTNSKITSDLLLLQATKQHGSVRFVCIIFTTYIKVCPHVEFVYLMRLMVCDQQHSVTDICAISISADIR